MGSSPMDTGIVEVWTDGGCKPNPGPGGWAAVLRYKDHERELSGAEPKSTNNRMELTAAAGRAGGADAATPGVVLHTDSEYRAQRHHPLATPAGCGLNWRNAPGDPVANMDLWRRLRSTPPKPPTRWSGAGCAATTAT